MPITVIKADTAPLWDACVDRFLTDAGAPTRPTRHAAHLWLTQRSQRDLLLEAAVARGIPGWLAPPFSFLSELPKRFHAGSSPIDLLTRRQLISTISTAHARRSSIGAAQGTGIVRGHMLDAVFSELLPEGVTADRLGAALDHTADDEFARRRNEWLAAVYDEYLRTLHERGLYDPRAVHAIIADAVRAGALSGAIGGAHRLHVYGLYSARTRRALLHELSAQTAVEVLLYVPAASTEFDELGPVEHIAGDDRTPMAVQPAPDATRELQWVAARVKELLLGGEEPHRIAVIARTGREDTRAACRHLESAGVPCTARIRRPLSGIPVLSLILELFRGAGEGWTYRIVRSVIGSSYTRLHIDLRLLDEIAARARPSTLAAWEQELRGLEDVRQEDESTGEVRRSRSERIERHTDRFRELRTLLEPLSGMRSEHDWVALTRDLIQSDRLYLQQSLCRVPYERYDVVRFDQRGFRRLEALLDEWSGVADTKGEISGAEWYRLLRRMLEGQELVLSTPGQKGVQVLEAQDAALVPFRHTLVIHVNDGVFPVHASEGGIFSEEERSALIDAGLPLENRGLALQREHALWDAITTSGSVTASWRTTDPRGTPLLPSLVLPAHNVSSELPRSLDLLSDAVTRDQTRQVAAANLTGDTADVGAVDNVVTSEFAVMRRAILHAHAEQSRGVPDRSQPAAPGMWNGVIRDPLVLEELRTRYGSGHVWSASQLQTYTRCPFFFLIDRVLRLRPLEEAEEATSPLTFGGIAHDILEQFYATSLDNMPVALAGAAAARLDDVIAGVMSERESGGDWLGTPALWGVTKEGIADVVRSYVAWELEHMNEKGERPWRCEYQLADAAGQPVVIAGRDVAGRSVQLRMTGRVDRIDIDRKGRYHVLDYKSSSIPASKGYADGVLLQAPLYSEALRQSAGLDVARARYRALKKPGKPQNGASIDSGTAKYDNALAFAFSVPTRVHAGLFEAAVAASSGWLSWDPDLSVCRTQAVLEDGHRFHD